MPKKFKGENSKAVEARARKAAQKQEEKELKERQAEDEYWKDEDKHVMRKQQRKDDKEQKRLEALQRKQEKQKLLEEEMHALKSVKPAVATKVTRAEIQIQRERQEAAAAAERKKEAIPYDERPLEENVNRLIPEGDSARSVEDAISVLSVKEQELEKHPEKRMKAAYQEYENLNLPRLKSENPNLRLSQLKQMLKKDWMKSPDNPMNKRTAAYNQK